MLISGNSYLRKRPNQESDSFWSSSSEKDLIKFEVSLIDSIFEKKNLNRRCEISRKERLNRQSGNYYKKFYLCLFWKKYLKHLYKRIYKYKSGELFKNVEYILKNMNTDRHLAIWFMNSASESRIKSKHENGKVYYRNPYFKLSLRNFTEGQANLVLQWFEQRYNLYPEKLKTNNNWIICFSVKDSKILFPKIRPYIVQLDSMKNKFRLCLERY